MKKTILPFCDKGHCYYISPNNGNLLKVNKDIFDNHSIEKRISNVLKSVDNPFSIESLTPHNHIFNIDKDTFKRLCQYHKILFLLGNKHFLISQIYASFENYLFDNSIEAFDAISKIEEQKDFKNQLCLQRSLLVLKTSNSFRKNGVLFIGATFPSGKMHAWIIENGVQPDRMDRDWIMYKPLLAIHY
jgi:hypothetical protein